MNQSDVNVEVVPTDFTHLQQEGEKENQNDDGFQLSDDDWSCTSTNTSDDDHAVRRRSRYPAFNLKAKKIFNMFGHGF